MTDTASGMFEAGLVASKMWRELGEQIAAAIPDLISTPNDDPVKAIHWATCAEACFWKATGECDTHDVKDVLPKSYGAADSVERSPDTTPPSNGS